MFTGIIESVRPVVSLREKEGNLRARIRKPAAWKLKVGQSIAIDGVCSTVVRHGTNYFEIDYMPETLSKTTMQHLERGTRLNLERSVSPLSPLDGHLVQGHVDCTSRVVSVVQRSGKYEATVNIPRALKRYIAPHGAITLSGVSLTVARTTQQTFTVALIPHTLRHSNLKDLKKGDMINLEVDLLARYVVNAVGKYNY